MNANHGKLGTVLAAMMLAVTLGACAVDRDGNGSVAGAPPVDQGYSHDIYFY